MNPNNHLWEMEVNGVSMYAGIRQGSHKSFYTF